MMVSQKLLLGLFLIPSFSAAEIRQKAIIEFTFGGVSLSSSVVNQVNQVYDKLPFGFEIEMEVVSRRDRLRDFSLASFLSEKRSLAIKKHLVSRGVDESNLKIITYDRRGVEQTSLGVSGVIPEKRIFALVVSRMPDMPLQFTASGFDPFSNHCNTYTIRDEDTSYVFLFDGSELSIPPHAFRSKTGIPMSCKFIDLNVCYYASKEDFILADITSNSAKRMLETAGMFYLSASCEGVDLELKPGKMASIFIPSNNPKSDMLVFEGRDEFDITNWNRMPWSEIDVLGADTIVDEWDYIEGDGEWERADGYLMEVSTLGWINCDRFYEVDNPVQLVADLGVGYDSLAVRMVFKSINSILPGYLQNRKGRVAFDGIPSNESVMLIAFGKQNGQYFWDSIELITGSKAIQALNPTLVSRDEFLSEVRKLN